jgi:hypothetical protein
VGVRWGGLGRSAGFGVAVVVFGAGCGAAGHVAALPSASVSHPLVVASASPSLSPTAVPGGPPAEPETAAGAVAFVRAYFAAQSAVVSSEATTQLRKYFQATCRVCALLPDYIDTAARPEHQHLRGGQYKLSAVGKPVLLAVGTYTLDVSFTLSPLLIYNQSSRLVSSEPGATGTLNLTAAYRSKTSTWTITRVLDLS